MRLFGFDGTIRKWLADEEEDVVSISNCEVKKSRHSDQLEVHVFKVFIHCNNTISVVQ